MQTTSDEVLIGRIAGGDRLAMQVLFARHHVRVYRFVLRMVRNEATLKEQNAGYQTASVSGTASREGSFALIRFQPQASAADITRFLESNKLSIAGGPAAGGLYRVRIAETKPPKADLDRRMQTLQSDKIIGFIAPTE
jgi:hypothetical protein